MRVIDLQKNTYRILSNGNVAFLNRKYIPNDLDGYAQDDRNFCIFHPIVSDCTDRVKKKEYVKCCKRTAITYYCNKLKEKVTFKQCKECEQTSKV